ncbi:MAG: hypothetical protein KGH64_04880 [Candidatus Micrarchaeota archaeon]|nr:hypothetical protein [Candidatus Micrarchaeota archaeon]MDE1834646.1 hypothetical protein [Candidatus Micrarchaeota archaeon]MDE1859641.1 hypothetical protein [Candidatus Micrarchaeota archaeon]
MGFVDDFLSSKKFVWHGFRSLKSVSKALSKKILSEYGQPALIVYIERGGMGLGRRLSDALGEVSAKIRRDMGKKVVTCTVFFKPLPVANADLYLHELTNGKWVIFGCEENEFKGKI